MVHIVCNIDSHYTEHCGVMLTSLFVHNPDQKFVIHIVNSGLADFDKIRLFKFAGEYGAEVFYYDVPIALLENFPIKATDHLSLASYLRVFMPELLPGTIDKVLYLDCDLIVVDSIEELWNMDITAFAVAAVEERPPFNILSPQKLGYPVEYSYFNTGVMLVNLKRWREMAMTDLSKKFIAENYQKIVHHDQDVINALLFRERTFLSIRWNVMDFFVFVKPDIQECRLEGLKKSLQHPSIIHFTGSRKPWLHNCDSPFRDLYVRLARQNHWNVITRKQNIHYHFRRVFYEVLFSLKLKKRKTLKKV